MHGGDKIRQPLHYSKDTIFEGLKGRGIAFNLVLELIKWLNQMLF